MLAASHTRYEKFNFIWQAESRSVLVIVMPDGGEKIPFEGFINFR